MAPVATTGSRAATATTNYTVTTGGTDRITWNPGADNDTVYGGDGSDVTELNGNPMADEFRIVPAGGRVLIVRDPGSFVVDTDTEMIVVDAAAATTRSRARPAWPLPDYDERA